MFIDRKWPTKELIDKVSPDNPVVLSRADGHSVLVNSYVLKASGITKDSFRSFRRRDTEGSCYRMNQPEYLKENAKNLIKTGAVKTGRTPEEESDKNT